MVGGLDSVVCHDDDEYRDDSAVPHGSGAAEYAGVALLLREGTAVATGRCRVGTGKGRAARAGDNEEYPVPCTTAVVAGVGAAAAATGAAGWLTGSSGREWHGMVIPEGKVVVAPWHEEGRFKAAVPTTAAAAAPVE
jgi:hypothetical protein